jgi:hypothetical protein
MNGWPAVAIIVVAQIAVAVFLIRVAARRLWDYLAISVLTIASVRPTAQHITGDVSRYLPAAIVMHFAGQLSGRLYPCHLRVM